MFSLVSYSFRFYLATMSTITKPDDLNIRRTPSLEHIVNKISFATVKSGKLIPGLGFTVTPHARGGN